MFAGHARKSFEFVVSFATKEATAAAIERMDAITHGEWIYYIVVDIATLLLEFSIPKRISTEEMTALEEKTSVKFWFVEPDNVVDILLAIEVN